MANTLQIRNVPEALHQAIAQQARSRGLTISQYLLRRIAEIEGKPEINEVLADHRARSRGRRHARPGVTTDIIADDRQR